MIAPFVLIASVLIGFDYLTIVVSLLLCAAVGMFWFGWLQFNRFSLDEWVESGERARIQARIAELEPVESDLRILESKCRELERQVEHYRFQLHARQAKQPKQSQPVAAQQPKPQAQSNPVPQVVVDARSIVQRWFLDVDQDNHPNVSKHSLTDAGMGVDRQRAAWELLTQLDIAGRAGTGDNAKRVITIDDETEINHRIQLHLDNLQRDGNGYVQN